jgi:hypothetical protein
MRLNGIKGTGVIDEQSLFIEMLGDIVEKYTDCIISGFALQICKLEHINCITNRWH